MHRGLISNDGGSPVEPGSAEKIKSKHILLIINDMHHSFSSLALWVSSEKFEPVQVSDTEKGLLFLEKNSTRVGMVIVDLKSPPLGGGGFLQKSRKIAPQIPILMTAPLGPILFRDGEFYNVAGLNLKDHINEILTTVLDKTPAKQQKTPLISFSEKDRYGEIIGQSPAMNQIYQCIKKLEKSCATVLIQGESGTGKELVTRTIHRTGARKNNPLITLNCGAIPAGLMESELFGHERGAFTGAVARRIGHFEQADKGTLFLDEISELALDLQVKLLRVLQEGEFSKVGSNKPQRTDVRIIAATNQDLKEIVGKGLFRKDLFYRLNVVPIHIPPLRQRKEDIRPLMEFFFEEAVEHPGERRPSIDSDALDALLAYNYPGNVRELSNIVERIMVLYSGDRICFSDLPKEVQKIIPSEDSGIINDLPRGGVPLQQVEKELILKTLQITKGNKKAAAKALGITRRLLYLRLERYGLMKTTRVTTGGIVLNTVT